MLFKIVKSISVKSIVVCLVAAAFSPITPARAVETSMDLVFNIPSYDKAIILPFQGIGGGGIDIDWGDSATTTGFTSASTGPTHTYANAGVYTVKVSLNASAGSVTTFGVDPSIGWPGTYAWSDDQDYLTAVTSWGSLGLTSLAHAFRDCPNLTALPTSLPSTVTNLESLFDSSYIFGGAQPPAKFTADISGWNTVNVTNMSGTFKYTDFNQDIGSWNTSNVTNMTQMFTGDGYFNKNIGSWNTSKVTNMMMMFYGGSSFNQNIGSWNTSSVTNMSEMFRNASFFNQNISSWNTANVTNMSGMFSGTDGSIVTNFNQNISSWNTANVTNMSGMFLKNNAFNQNISSWNTANVTNMNDMFYFAAAFNQNISSWDITKLTTATRFYNYSGTSSVNYGNLLIGWEAQTQLSNVSFGANTLRYPASAATARTALISSPSSWTISDAGFQQTGIPGTPTAVAGDSQANVTAVIPTSGETPTSYTITAYPGPTFSVAGPTCTVSDPGASMVCTVTGLTNGTQYKFKATGFSTTGGTSTASLASSTVTPIAQPGIPGTPTAVAGNAQATVTFAAPTTGGAPVTYTVTSNPEGKTCTSTSPTRSCVVTGLTNGTSYTFSVTATNSAGTSSSSSDSAAVSPIAPPGAPGTPTVVSGDGSATITVVAPSTGGDPVSYTVVSTPSSRTCTITVPSTSCEITGLTNGTGYTFKASATNGGGTSSYSVDSSSVTPVAAIPGTPGTPTVVAGDGQATITVVAPTTGGAPVTYTVTSNPEGKTCTVTAPASTCIITGLTNGTSYTFAVTATNGGGTSGNSMASASSTPASVSSPEGSTSNVGALSIIVPTSQPEQGTSTTTIGGQSIKSTTTINSSAETLTISNGGRYAASLTYSIRNQKNIVPLTLNKTIGAQAGAHINVTGNGFKSKARVYVYLISTNGASTLLGSIIANKSGKVSSKLLVPNSLVSGKYTLQLNGYTNKSNLVSSRNLGMQVLIDHGVIYFKADTAKLSASERSSLKELIKTISAGESIVLYGFTAGSTKSQYKKANIKLARLRAEEVKQVFTAEGISVSITIKPKGAVAINGKHNPINRRVEIKSIK